MDPNFNLQTRTAHWLMKFAGRVITFRRIGSQKASSHRLGLELVPQSELHHTRIGKQSRIVAKRAAVGQRQTQALNVKPGQVQGVEDVPTELQRLRLLPRHLPTLA